MKTQTVKIKVEFTHKENEEFDGMFTFTLKESSCPDGETQEEVFLNREFDDGRPSYIKNIPTGNKKIEDFKEYCLDWIRDNYIAHISTVMECKTGGEI